MRSCPEDLSPVEYVENDKDILNTLQNKHTQTHKKQKDVAVRGGLGNTQTLPHINMKTCIQDKHIAWIERRGMQSHLLNTYVASSFDVKQAEVHKQINM